MYQIQINHEDKGSPNQPKTVDKKITKIAKQDTTHTKLDKSSKYKDWSSKRVLFYEKNDHHIMIPMLPIGQFKIGTKFFENILFSYLFRT